MELKDLKFEIADEIATITLDRPDTRNALSMDMRAAFDRIIPVIKEKAGTEIKAVVITGAGGKAFSAGGDVKGMGAGSSGRNGPAGRQYMRSSHNRLYDILNLEVPVIAAVDGAAAGAGCNLALACDFVLATPRSFFLQAFGRIGLVPDWSGFFLLPRIVGLQRAKELIFTARRLGVEEAKELGIVHAIYPEEDFMTHVYEFAGRFRHASTSAIGIAKNILNQSFNLDHRALLEMEAFAQPLARDTDYHVEAVRRFKAKEPAMFNWEAFEQEAGSGKAAAE